ncbi:hypothetical protein [Kribbella sp. NPDC049584]|uniref:hypothetical protein n=1 Tax=Kribbella sp. NPDC049584 TaxID=3154833 RepID=UPI003429AAC4
MACRTSQPTRVPYVPVRLASANDYSRLPDDKPGISGALVVADPVATGAVRINPRNGYPEYVEHGRLALYNDVTTEEYTVPPALQDRMILEADAATPHNKFVVHTLPSSHSSFASMPDRLVSTLLQG